MMIDGFGHAPPEASAVPDELPVLPLRDLVIFPYIIVPLSVARDRSILAVEQALAGDRMLLLVAQRDDRELEPGFAQLHEVGSAALVMRMLKLPDGNVRILVQGVARARIERPVPGPGALRAAVLPLAEPEAPATLETAARVRSAQTALERLVALGKTVPPEVMVIAQNLRDPGRLADLAASSLDLELGQAQALLETIDPVARLGAVVGALNREAELLEMQQRIAGEARSQVDRSQREYLLRQQLRAIEKELGEDAELAGEARQLRERVAASRMPAEARSETLRQVDRLQRMQPDAAEAASLRAWLDVAAGLPWGRFTRDRVDLARAAAILDRDHHGLERVKERILELLAVRKLRRRGRGPILCLVGPPGVGKTSLGQSIARALGRRFVRIALGGVRDEAEIRGHRRTYVGALPGRILQAIQQAGSQNPVFMIDEVDKLGADFRGDPSAALLEVLDPAQNASFRDHYLGLPFDLSGVLFIATANVLDPLPPAFRDRLEVIEIEGYTEEEKLAIARRWLLPRQLEECGLEPRHVTLPDAALAALVRGWTREARLRSLERELGRLCRRVARDVAGGADRAHRIGAAALHRYLGAPRIPAAEPEHEPAVGVARGLAWTAAGGEVLTVEALVMPGRGTLILTGQLGEVMKESAHAARSWLRAHAAALGIDARRLRASDLHVHVPEGAIPKDGPSAGVAIVAAVCSALTGRPARADLAMTGEITLRGRVLPVGGIRQKLLAARRAGLAAVLLPRANRRDADELPEAIRKSLRIELVDDLGALLARAVPGAR